MAYHKGTYVSIVVALLLAGDGLVNAKLHVCRTNYVNASTSFSKNHTCFGMPDESCVHWTTLPLTMSVTMPDFNFREALTNCHHKENFCTNLPYTTAYC